MIQISSALAQGYDLGTSDGQWRETRGNEQTAQVIEETSTADESKYNPALPNDLDIFSDLPELVFKNEDACVFINYLRKAIQKAWASSELDNVTLAKLVVSEYTETGLTIDWIFSYFRVYFSFDTREGNYFGEIMNDPESGKFSSKSEKFNVESYQESTEAILKNVILMLK